MTRIVALGAALVLCGCTAHGASSPYLQPPTLSRADAEQLMLRADELRRLAFEFPGNANLAHAFGGSALRKLEAQSESFSRRGLREEERSQTRALVFWDPVAAEAVLQVVAETRLVSHDQPNPAWTRTLRQWWARLQDMNGDWRVVDQENLPPDRWRHVAPAP